VAVTEVLLFVNKVSLGTWFILASNFGVVLAAVAPGVTGIVNDFVLPDANGLALTQVTVAAVELQPQPLLTKLVGAVKPSGKSNTTVITPVLAAVPTLSIVIIILLASPCAICVVIGSRLIAISGAGALCTGLLGVIGLAALLLVATSPLAGLVLALNSGDVPMVLAFGVTGILNVLLAAVLIGLVVLQITELPPAELVRLQLQPLDTNDAGVVTPNGNATVVVTMPLVAAVPMLETVTGISLGTLATSGVLGWPMLVVKSGTLWAATGVLGVSGVAALLPVWVSPATGAVVALNTGEVLTVETDGVIGTLIVLLVPFGMAVLVLQETVELTVWQLQPFVVNDDGAVTPAGNVTVVLIGPAAVAEPTLATTTGKVLG
jgi:hypothetical protein